MILDWTKHLKTAEEKDLYKQSLTRVKWVLEDLRRLVRSNEASVEATETSPKAFDNPNWPYRQAYANGYKQALKDVDKLITIDQ